MGGRARCSRRSEGGKTHKYIAVEVMVQTDDEHGKDGTCTVGRCTSLAIRLQCERYFIGQHSVPA